MRDRCACTVVSKQTLPLSRVLARSFLAQHPDVPFVTLLADEVQGRFDPSQEPGDLIEWSSIALPWREQLKVTHAQHALTCAAAPLLIDHLFDAGYRRVLFLKQESLVLSRLDMLFDALSRHAVILTPHAGQPVDADDGDRRELMFLRSGIYNVGVFGATDRARPFIRWWRDRVAECCSLSVEQGLHYEQRWMDFAPVFAPDLGVLRDPAINIGHWNLPLRGLTYEDGTLRLDGRPCLIFRFSGYSPDAPETVTKYYSRLQPADIPAVWPLFTRVRAELHLEGWAECTRWPFAFETTR